MPELAEASFEVDMITFVLQNLQYLNCELFPREKKIIAAIDH